MKISEIGITYNTPTYIYFWNRLVKPKYKELRREFQRMKRRTIGEKFSNFVYDLKKIKPSKWYGMAKKLGAFSGQNDFDGPIIEELERLNDQQADEKIADFFQPHQMNTPRLI